MSIYATVQVKKLLRELSDTKLSSTLVASIKAGTIKISASSFAEATADQRKSLDKYLDGKAANFVTNGKFGTRIDDSSVKDQTKLAKVRADYKEQIEALNKRLAELGATWEYAEYRRSK